MWSGDKLKFRVLFVCSGNTCRSPLAAASFRKRVPKRLRRMVEIDSAGIHALTGLPASVEAELMAFLKGFDLSGHRSKALSEVLIESADVVLCMENAHVEYLCSRFPAMAEKIHLLTAYHGGKGGDIDDPFRRGIAAYRSVFRKIERELNRIEKAIWKTVREKVAR